MMIDKPRIIDTVIEKLKRLPKGSGLDLRTFKRDRSVIIIKKSETELRILQNGFDQHAFSVKQDKLKKQLKTLLKKEFPRSNKIRLQVLNSADLQK